MRLYEPAIPPPPGGESVPPPLWHVERDRALFAGPLGHNVPHRHAAPVLLAGLYGDIRLRIGESPWRRSPAAIVPAGQSYEFDMGGAPLSVLYVEPDLAGLAGLKPLLHSREEIDGVLLGEAAIAGSVRSLYESADSMQAVSLALDDLIGFGRRRGGDIVDPRMRQLVRRLSGDLTDTLPAETLAAEIGLSPSRMQHLFASQVGVPMRRYRIWRRLRGAIAAVAGGCSNTEAAHAAGFFDQAHFVRAFRTTFGAAPGLARLRRT